MRTMELPLSFYSYQDLYEQKVIRNHAMPNKLII